MMLQTFGAQAAAGQFRTPRHIIDFIVGIVNPEKHETILDPACGTAGFLASAYQHAGKVSRLSAQDGRSWRRTPLVTTYRRRWCVSLR